jgi:hypothetical protein
MKAAALAALVLFASPSDEITYTAQSVNTAAVGTPVKMKILRWSTEDELRPVTTALAAPPAQPSEVAQANAAAGRGRGAATGRGRGRGGPAPAPLSPIDAFAAALRRAQTVGYIWTNEITGYAIKHAWHTSLPNGTERVILASDRRLGAYSNRWKSASPEPDYAFTLVELRVGPNGVIEGKTSLTARVTVDEAAHIVGLENYNSTLTTLEHTRR